ncbi:MAG: lytic murein transglycosylase [Pseudomonadota bacterium]
MRPKTHGILVQLVVLLSFIVPAQAETQPDWNSFIDSVRAEASSQGVSQATLDVALNGIEPIDRVIELDRRQPEGTVTFAEYMASRMPPALIAEARRNYDEHLPLLISVSDVYGVDPEAVIALWGHETRFGTYTGGFDVIAALATLAWDPRRSDFFRRELMHALKILDEGHITKEKMVGSWAGAMGQSQFMPSSFMGYAVDWDKDGRRDIWTTRGDVFASASNYLSSYGWELDEPWGAAVNLPAGMGAAQSGHDSPRPLQAWLDEGVTFVGARPAVAADEPTTLAMPAGEGGPAFLVFSNYRVILRWNRSDYFAMSVVRLADEIVTR